MRKDDIPADAVAAEFRCPFCGGKAAALRAGAVIHALPACATFGRLDPLEYLRAVNRRARELDAHNN